MLVKIRTDYDGSPWIAAGKIYEAALVNDERSRFHGTYKFMGELGSPCYTRLERSIHIGGKDWEIVK
nr:MAG TPA: hypothetical protein [Caudoviricetes sp.]